MLEIEIKAPCGDIREKLKDVGAVFIKKERQEDTYYNAPHKDFRETDEVLRVRRVGSSYLLTYKGSREDDGTKARQEVEIPIDRGMDEILHKLGFSKGATLEKDREIYDLGDVLVSVDDVEGLGRFIELETTDYKHKERLFEILNNLGIERDKVIVKSYMEMIEERG